MPCLPLASLFCQRRADLIRVCFLYLFGGLYFDVKYQLVRSLAEFMRSLEGITLSTAMSGPSDLNVRHCCGAEKTSGECNVHQGFIEATPGHPILEALIDFTLEHAEESRTHYLVFCDAFRNILREQSVCEPGKHGDVLILRERTGWCGDFAFPRGNFLWHEGVAYFSRRPAEGRVVAVGTVAHDGVPSNRSACSRTIWRHPSWMRICMGVCRPCLRPRTNSGPSNGWFPILCEHIAPPRLVE